MIRGDLGYAHVHSEYDAMGNVTAQYYFDVNDRSILKKEGGFASFRDRYENGKWVEGRYYDTNGDLTLRSDTGYAVIELKYNDYGQRTAEYYYGTDEQPVISTEYFCAGTILRSGMSGWTENQ